MSEDRRKELCTEMASVLPILRKAIAVSQTQLAGLAGVSRSTINNMERNRAMSWKDFLALLMIFSRHENAMRLIDAYRLYPEEVDTFLTGGFAKEA